MKLHLPKMLMTAVIAITTLSYHAAQGAITETEGTPVDGVTPVTVTFTNNSQDINFDNYTDTAEKTYLLLFDTTSSGNNFFRKDDCSTDVAVQIGRTDNGQLVSGSGLYITNGYSGSTSDYREYGFGGTITGAGEFKFSTTSTADYLNFIFSGNMSAYTGNMTLDGEKKHNKLTFNGNTSGTGTITALGSNSVVVNGATMKNSSIQAGTLSVSGTSTFAGDVYAVTLNIADGSNVTFNGTLEVIGTAIETEDAGFVATSNGIQTVGLNGYAAVKGKWLIANNQFSMGADATLKGYASTEFEEGTGLVATMQDGYGKVVDKTRFYVNVGTVTWNTNGYTDKTATIYEVATDATLDLNGNSFEGKTVKLAQDSILTNSSGSFTDNSILLSKIELSGDANLNIVKNHGLLTYAWGDSSLALNGHTLTKSGSATLYLVKTAVSGGGEIAVTEGTLQIGSSVNNANARNKITSATDVEFSTSADGRITLVNGAELHAKAISGEDGSVEGAAGTLLKLTSDTDYSYGGDISGTVNVEKNGLGTQALNGTNTLGAITLNAGALAFGGNTTADSLTLGENAGLVFGGGKLSVVNALALDSTIITLAQGMEFATAEDYELLTVTGEGNTLSVNGWENWVGNTYNIGGVDYTTGLNLANNTLSVRFTAMPIPEPATATLSLLALAAMAARRRRK